MERIYCGKINKDFIGKEVTVYGWVHSRRDHGGVIFVDLRDREGIVQVVFQPDNSEIFSKAEKIRNEYVLKVKGKVRKRPEGTENKKLYSGEVEILCSEFDILNTSKVLPFEISDYKEVSEELRLKYRYLDLRRSEMLNRIKLRNNLMNTIRSFFNKEGFIEVDTPFLTKSTPEGARDFLVPSRLNPGTFYALPQSPQLFKQILMIAGIDKYFQIVRCFRDEDLRADRQPEFTQIDYEMSFVDENDVISFTERLLQKIFESVGLEVKIPFLRLSYAEAISKYGSDKPDLRYGLEINNLTDIFKNTNFKVFRETIENKGEINCIVVKNGNLLSRQQIDNYIEFAKSSGMKGLAWIKHIDGHFESNIVKFFSKEELDMLAKTLQLKNSEIIFFSADEHQKSCEFLGLLRNKLAKDLNLINNSEYKFVWIVDFPLFEFSLEENKIVSVHHPFTLPKKEDMHLLDIQPLRVRSCGYDIILNGVELGGGSIRIHEPELQKKIFNILGLSEEEIENKFGFLIEALSYGAPPHGGLALGFDRLLAILTGVNSIREVIPFPKTQKGLCLLTNAPSSVTKKQLNELNIQLKTKE
ncbi:MAG: aspartate--tRNA ligase [Endomicrobiia bacterium]